jgi:hypothetical protein
LCANFSSCNCGIFTFLLKEINAPYWNTNRHPNECNHTVLRPTQTERTSKEIKVWSNFGVTEILKKIIQKGERLNDETDARKITIKLHRKKLCGDTDDSASCFRRYLKKALLSLKFPVFECLLLWK